MLDNPKHGRKSEAGALAQLLGREERLEDARLDLSIHASACIAHGHHHIGAGPRWQVGLRVLLVKNDVGSFDGEVPACGHRITRVHDEIQDDLLDMAWIDLDPARRLWRRP